MTEKGNKEVKEKDYLNEEVELALHKDDGKYKDDVVVILNGTAIKIPRGKTVKIKRKYALIVNQSLHQQAIATEKAEALQSGEK